jgi:hypothetical protein
MIKYSSSQSDWGKPVLTDGSGQVVRPTNFWQVAPITTTFIESQPTTNQTTNIAAGRNLHIHSIAFSTTGITNTIALPTTNSFNGDIALVVHQGPTSSVTAVRTAGAGTNLITLNQSEEAVEFVYYNNVWQFNHNLSFIEPIFFSGTNAAANRAASRTNLGLGETNTVTFGNINGNQMIVTGTNISETGVLAGGGFYISDENTNNTAEVFIFGGDAAERLRANARTNLGLGATWLTNANVTNFRSAIGLGAGNEANFESVFVSQQFVVTDGSNSFASIAFDEANFGVGIAIGSPLGISFYGTNAAIAAATTRTNLGLGLPALTNTSNTNFQAAVFTTNAAPTNTANVSGINFNTKVGWMDVTLNIGGTNKVFRIPLFQ